MPFLPFVLAVASPSADAAEVQFDGFYRARGRAFDTLSLDRTSPQNEGLALYAQHRLWLAPRFLLSDDVGVYVEIRGLDGVVWGTQPGPSTDINDIHPTLPELDLTAPTSTTDETSPLLDFTLWRAYARVNTKIGQFKFGRVPLIWGTGIWLNDGISVDPDDADYGDTTDRVQWELLVQDQFYVSLALDIPVESFIGETDDTTGYSLGVAYRTESVNAGILARVDHTGSRVIDTQDVGQLTVFTGDATLHATLGKLDVQAEVLGQFGGGDLDAEFNDANIFAWGATLHANMELDAWNLALRGGLATGDSVTDDKNFKTFTFDRDYSPGMFLFEQPMPILAQPAPAANESNGNRNFDEVLTTNALSNALFIKPTLSRRIVQGLWVDASWFNARVARTSKIAGQNQLRSYGNEGQLGVRYDGIEHFEFSGRFGMFFPGSVFTVNPDDITVTTGFEDPAFGGQVTARVVF